MCYDVFTFVTSQIELDLYGVALRGQPYRVTYYHGLFMMPKQSSMDWVAYKTADASLSALGAPADLVSGESPFPVHRRRLLAVPSHGDGGEGALQVSTRTLIPSWRP